MNRHHRIWRLSPYIGSEEYKHKHDCSKTRTGSLLSVWCLLPQEPSMQLYQQLSYALWCAPNSEQIQDHRSEAEGYYLILHTVQATNTCCNIVVTFAFSVDVRTTEGNSGHKMLIMDIEYQTGYTLAVHMMQFGSGCTQSSSTTQLLTLTQFSYHC